MKPPLLKAAAETFVFAPPYSPQGEVLVKISHSHSPARLPRGIARRTLPLLVSAALLGLGTAAGHAQAREARVPLAVSHTTPALASARLVARTPSTRPLALTFVLPLRNRATLDSQIRRISDPHDSLYGHYLSPEEFAEQFGPDPAGADAVAAFAQAHGLSVGPVSGGGTLVPVSGTAGAVEAAFGIHLNDYVSADGRAFFAPDRQPTVSPDLAGRVLSVLGLSSGQKPHPFSRRAAVSPLLAYNGTSGLSPTDVRNIYGLAGTTTKGTGQVAGLFEVGTYTPSDVKQYFTAYGISIPVSTLSVDGYNTASTPGDAAAEITLDVDMLAALSPGLSQIRVYEGTDSPTASFTQLLVDTFTQMANETAANRPNVISVSYGDSENFYAASDYQALDQATAQLARQGQTICVSSGDAGAYTDQTGGLTEAPNASFPATDPYVLSVGGTDLNDTLDDNSNCVYGSETSWADPADTGRGPIGTGGGGGFSAYFPLPSYQSGAFTAAGNPQGSLTKRNVPDVSLYGDYDTGGYDVYFSDPIYGPDWYGYNGTSASSPLWASFLANVNQARAATGQPAIGFSNPAIYGAAESASYSSLFHDIADGSSNLYYKTVRGYDNSTGWGSFIGGKLLTVLSAAPASGPNATQVRFFPRSGYESRMTGGKFQGSYDGTTYTDLATITQTPASGQYTTVTFASPASSRYLRYLAPNGSYGNIAEIEFDSSTGSGVAKITGTAFGTAGSYGNSGNTYAKALDGSTSTFFDAPTGNGVYVGIDRGASASWQVRYFPRIGLESRMVGGKFQGSHDNSTWTTLDTVTATPGDVYTTAALSADPATFRYLRYLSPSGGYGNVAEIEFDSQGKKLTGTGFGTAGSYGSSGNTFTKALDGSTSTFFDAPIGNGVCVGIDQGG